MHPCRVRGPSRESPMEPAAGDIVVTKVADRYHIGRVQSDGKPLVTIGVVNNLDDALVLACRVVAEPKRVILWGGSTKYSEIDCAKRRSRGPASS
jgi:hypothetical protein